MLDDFEPWLPDEDYVQVGDPRFEACGGSLYEYCEPIAMKNYGILTSSMIFDTFESESAVRCRISGRNEACGGGKT